MLKFSPVIVGLGVALGYYMYQNKKKEPATYTAALTFMLNDDKGMQSNLGSVLGLNLGSVSSKSGFMSLDKINELLLTRQIMQRALFQKVVMNSRKDDKPRLDFIINHYLDYFTYPSYDPKNFYFTTDSFKIFNRQENTTLLSVYRQVTGGQLSKFISPGGIFNMGYTSVNEEFTYEFLYALYRNLEDYYSSTSRAKQDTLYKAAIERKAVLRARVEAAEKAYVGFKNRNGAESVGQYYTQIQQQFLARELQMEMESYFASVRAEEAAQVALEQQRFATIFQLIDPPIYPLMQQRVNASMHFVIGFALAAFLSTLVVVGQKFAREFLKKRKLAETPNPDELQTPNVS